MNTMSSTNKKVSSLVDHIADTFRAKVGPEASQPACAAVCVCVLLFFLTVPLDMSQITFVVFGALTYAALQALQVRPVNKVRAVRSCAAKCYKVEANDSRWCSHERWPVTSRPAPRSRLPAPSSNKRPQPQALPTLPAPSAAPRPEVRKPSSQPISAPIFQGQGWEAEVDELLGQIMPSPEGERIVKAVADFVEQRIKPLIPEVEVLGFASGDLVRGTAFGVAVPEVDIVVNVSPHILVQRLQGRFSKGTVSSMKLDVRKLQKSAIRACTDQLVSAGGFKFRRSAFRGEEPKVTLLVPASFGVSDESIPIDFHVNSTTPLYNMALLTECGQKEARSRALILLVKRWAKDRGVCHAAKGHLSPYPWSLLVIYFLQVGKASESSGPLLPPVQELEVSSSLMGSHNKLPQATVSKLVRSASKLEPPDIQGPPKTVAELFKDFINFYSRTFDWTKEAICVRTGKRGPPSLNLPLHIIVDEETQASEVGPSIEDPFNPSRNLGVVMTCTALGRLHQEFARANELLINGCSLTELLQPWAPPERGSPDVEEDGLDAEKEDSSPH